MYNIIYSRIENGRVLFGKFSFRKTHESLLSMIINDSGSLFLDD